MRICTREGVTPNSEVIMRLVEDDQFQISTVFVWLAVLGMYTMGIWSLGYLEAWRVIENLLDSGADSSIVFPFRFILNHRS
ncbi:hypothetical protein BDW59DRAFT_142791 [Aspergillus cavernicola]|uniref:Peptidase A2 domain-containing protein n=1 Tax=Aspergillus cavernicola TaxID=176166 RepID=A0ABR4IP23_9EURO